MLGVIIKVKISRLFDSRTMVNLSEDFPRRKYVTEAPGKYDKREWSCLWCLCSSNFMLTHLETNINLKNFFYKKILPLNSSILLIVKHWRPNWEEHNLRAIVSRACKQTRTNEHFGVQPENCRLRFVHSRHLNYSCQKKKHELTEKLLQCQNHVLLWR